MVLITALSLGVGAMADTYAKKRLNGRHADEKFASAAAVKPTARVVRNVREFGAKTSAKPAENAKAIQAAIEAASAQGGGCVTVPAGTWNCGTLYLKSHVELHLDVGAVLMASSDLADYNGPDAFPENFGVKDEGWNACHLIIAYKCEDVAVTGPGVINGSGETFFAGSPAPVAETYTWKDWRTVKDKQNGRPGQMLVFWECKNVRIENVFLHDTPSWACFLMGCDDVIVRDYRVRSGPLNPCTDGIDIDCCRNVLVERAHIDVGDDAIAVRACSHRLGRDKPCENVTIRDAVIASTATDMRVGVGTGIIRNVTFENIIARRGGTSVIFNCFWGDPQKAGVDMENIVFRNIDFGAKWGPSFVSGGNHQTFGIRDVLFDNCRFASGRGSIEDKGRFKTENVRYDNCTFAN